MSTGPAKGNADGFVHESSRIGLNALALVVSRILVLALSLVQISVIFRALGVEGSGQFGFALNYPALFTVFATFGVPRLLVRDIARNPDIAWRYVWTATGLIALLSTLVLGAIAASIFLIESNPMIRWAVILASLSVVVLWALQSPFEALLMARERMLAVAVVNLITGAIRLLCTWIAIRAIPTSAAAHGAIALGNLAGFCMCAGAAIVIAGWERPRFQFSLALAQLRGSLAFTAGVFLSMIYFKSDLAILKWLEGESAAGIYTAVQRVMEPLLMMASLWGTAVFPALCRFSVNAPTTQEQLMKTNARLTLLIAFPVAFGVAVLAEPIIGLITGARAAEFGASVWVLRLMCAMTPFFYLNSLGQEFLYALHRNWYVPLAYGIASFASVAGNLLLIPRLGVPGVAVTAIAVNGLISILFVWNLRAVYASTHIASLAAKSTIACLVMAAAAYALAPHSLIAAILAGGLIYAGLQWLLRTLTQEERQLVGAMALGVFRRSAPLDGK